MVGHTTGAESQASPRAAVDDLQPYSRDMDELRLAVTGTDGVASGAPGGGFAVQVWINGIEMTERAAGLGMDPYDLLVPHNRLLPEHVPVTVPIARCGCGVYGCGETDVEIVQRESIVTWRWLKEKPGREKSEFDAGRYLEELARMSNDCSWETADRTAGRLILARFPSSATARDLRPDWLESAGRDREKFLVCVRYAERYQVYIAFDWQGHTPESLAEEVIQQLTEDPASWNAQWHAIHRGDAEPAIAGPQWTRARVPLSL